MDTDTAPFMLDEVILRVCDMTMRGSMARELECLIDIDPSTLWRFSAMRGACSRS